MLYFRETPICTALEKIATTIRKKHLSNLKYKGKEGKYFEWKSKISMSEFL